MRQRRPLKSDMKNEEGLGNGGHKSTLSHRSRPTAVSPAPEKVQAENSSNESTHNNFVPPRRLKQPTNNVATQSRIRYVLPCFRIRSTRSFIALIMVTCIIMLSITTFFMAHSMHTLSRHSPSSGMVLPSAKEWGVGRETRRKKRRQRTEQQIVDAPVEVGTISSSEHYLPKRIRERKQEVVTPIKSQVYEAHLASFYTKLAEKVALHELSFDEQDTLGQDMKIYSNIGCSVFNNLFHSKNNTTKSDYSDSEDSIRRFWQSHHASILDASRLGDTSFAHKNWTSTLLKSLSPYTLSDSISASNNLNRTDIERILGIMVRRLLALMHAKDGVEASLPPPLRIAIFGGPTVSGQGCHRGRGLSRASLQTNPAFCSFPYRLEQFLNWMLLPPPVLRRISSVAANAPIVEVINLGEEGTYSDYSEAIVRNRMYPLGQSPDIVVHAYSIDGYGRGLSDIQSFHTAVHHSFKKDLKDGCRREDQKPPPVILHAMLENNQSAADLTSIILGEAIDDVEEGETSLPLLDNNGINNVGGAFGMAGHLASSWVLAFEISHSILSYCTSNTFDPTHTSSITKQASTTDEHMFQCDNGIYPPCIFAIYSGAKGNVAKPSFLLQSLTPFMVENTGWSPTSDMTAGFSRKTGIVATSPGATMTMLFRNITRPVRRFDVLTLRSTSKIWRDGAAKFVLVTGGDFSHGEEAAEASVAVSKETSFEISAELIADGAEDRHVTYHFGIDLVDGENTAESGSDVLLRIILTKGDKFKILGLMLCE